MFEVAVASPEAQDRLSRLRLGSHSTSAQSSFSFLS